MSKRKNSTERRIPCNGCNRTTHHEVLQQKVIDFSEWDYHSEDIWQLLRCKGCDSVTSIRVHWNSEIVYEDGEPAEEIIYLPERTVRRIRVKAFMNMPDSLEKVYEELILAFNNDSRILCSIGLRAMLEAMCKDRALEAGLSESQLRKMTLQKLIDEGLKESVPKNITEHLHGFRFLGNEAAHDLRVPKKGELAEAIEVIEDIMNLLYNLDYRTGRLHRRYAEREESTRL